jgi:hypothetical protein
MGQVGYVGVYSSLAPFLSFLPFPSIIHPFVKNNKSRVGLGRFTKGKIGQQQQQQQQRTLGVVPFVPFVLPPSSSVWVCAQFHCQVSLCNELHEKTHLNSLRVSISLPTRPRTKTKLSHTPP